MSKEIEISKRPVFENVEELAEELGISRAYAYLALKNGTIPSIKLGKRFVIPRAAIAKWLETAGKPQVAA